MPTPFADPFPSTPMSKIRVEFDHEAFPSASLHDWEQFDRWADYNDPLWNQAKAFSDRHGLTEIERLKLTSFALFEQLHHLREQALKTAQFAPTLLTIEQAQVEAGEHAVTESLRRMGLL